MILVVSGSPRNQSTEYVCRETIDQLNQKGYKTEFWSIRGKTINFCTHCNYCRKREGCVFKDDMTELYPLLEDAEAYVFATPVYHGNVTGQLKTMMDRCRALFPQNRDVFRYKPVVSIAIGGDRVGGQESAIHQIQTFFIMNGGVPIGGGSFGANLGATFWSQDSLEKLREDQEGFNTLSKTLDHLDKYLRECR